MKKIVFILFMPVVVSAQSGYTTLAYTSELYNSVADPSIGVIVHKNDLKPQYPGGIFWHCDTCTVGADSIIKFPRFYGGMWVMTANLSRRVETHTGTTNGSGIDTITYDTPFAILPDVKASIKNGGQGQYVRTYNESVTGCRVQAYQYSQTTLLSVLLLTGNIVPLSGVETELLVTEK